ncbi:MAG: AAA family ATPase [Pseudomonadota bacterium]
MSILLILADAATWRGCVIYRFEHFELDARRQELRRKGDLVSITPKAFSVLIYLLQNCDRMVSKSELMETFWSRNASESALQKTISLLRKSLDDEDAGLPILKTVHGRGFRIVVDVIAPDPDEDHAPVPETAGLTEQRLVAVLCLKITGLNGHGSDPDAVDACLRAARALVAEYQGKLLHMMVNQFTATFGVAPDFEDSARRAAHCAWHLSRSAEIRTLRAAGACVTLGIDVGAIPLPGEENAWQAPSTLEIGAVSLADAGPPDAILISEAAFGQLSNEVDVTALDDRYRLTEISVLSTGIPGRPSKNPTGFVGRSAELAFLNSNFEDACNGSFRATALSGPAGIGKSRLTSEFLKALSDKDVRVCKVNCSAHLMNSALAPIRQICGALLPDGAEELAEDPVDAALLQLLIDDAAQPSPVLDGMSDRKRNARTLALIQQVLRLASEEEPLLIVFEDVHWLDATSRATVQALLRKGGIPRVFLLMTTRPAESPALPDSVLNLSPLGAEDSMRLIRAVPGGDSISDTDAAVLSTRASGNPFFLEELVLAARSGADVSLELPNTVQAVIEVRISALAPAQRSVLYVMAIAGEVTALDLLAQLSRRDVEALEEELVNLVQLGFLFEDETGFTFRHVLLSDTAYAMVAQQDRRRLHADIAHYLENSESPSRDETKAWHHQEAGNIAAAIGYWTKASYAAVHRSARAEAISFAKSGLALIEPEAPVSQEAELRLRLALATALMAVKGYGAPEVGEELERALSLSAVAGSAKAKVRVLMGLWVNTWVAGKLETSLQHARELLLRAERAGDPSLNLQAHAATGEVLTHLGCLEEAARHLQQGLEFAPEVASATITDQNSAVTCAAYAAWVAGMQGRKDALLTHVDTSRELSLVRENLFSEAIHFALCAEVFMFINDVEKTSELARQAISVSREHGFPFWLASGLVLEGWALGMAGRFEEAFPAIEEGISVFQRTGAGVQFTNWFGLKAETHLRAGQVQAGIEEGEKALAIAEKNRDSWFTPRVHSVLAALYSRQGETSKTAFHSNEASRLRQARQLDDTFVRISL